MGIDELKAAWNLQADEHNQWDSLGLDEMLSFAQEIEREACAKVCESRGPTLANSELLAELIRMRSNAEASSRPQRAEREE